MTRSEIQALIDALPSVGALSTGTVPVGGVVPIPDGVHTLDGPLLLDNNVWLSMSGPGCVIQYDHVSEPVMYLHTRAGHGYVEGTRITNGVLYNALGPAIKFDSSVVGEWAGVRLEHLIISSGGNAVDLRTLDGTSMGNFAYLNDIRIKSCGGIPFQVRAREFEVSNCWVINVTKNGLHPTEALFDFEGGAFVHNCWAESSRGCPMFRYRNGNYVHKTIHNEPHQTTSDGVPYQMVLDAAIVEADEIYFAGPNAPVYLTNASELTLTRKMICDDGNGGPAPVRSCYLSDGHVDNLLIFAGHAHIGRQPNPVASIPIRRQ